MTVSVWRRVQIINAIVRMPDEVISEEIQTTEGGAMKILTLLVQAKQGETQRKEERESIKRLCLNCTVAPAKRGVCGLTPK